MVILVGAGLTVLVAGALAIGWLAIWSRPSVGAPETAKSSSPTPTPTAVASGIPSPTAAEISALQGALASGSEDDLRPVVGATPGQALSADFVAKVKALGIHFDPSQGKSTGAGSVWEEDATDSSGTHWQVGLVRSQDGHIEISYAERAQ